MPYASHEDRLAYERRRTAARRAGKPVTPARRLARNDDQISTAYLTAVCEFTMWCQGKKIAFRDAMAVAMREYREAHA